MKTFTEEEVSDLLKEAVEATFRGMVNWLESDDVYIQNEITTEIADDEYVISATEMPFDKYIIPSLLEKGIVYNYSENM